MVILLSLLGCRIEVGPPGQRAAVAGEVTEVWVYTSMYQEVIDEMTPLIERDLPNVRVEWFQSGSEKIAQRWEAEHAAGGSRACVIATSDPGWYADLDQRALLLPYVSPRALQADRALVTPTYAPFRLSLMVLTASGEGPDRFQALSDPAWKGKFSSPDPLSSGTAYTTVAAWVAGYGWEWIDATRANGWVAAGGNSAVLARVESGERPVGVILLENLLAKPESPARPIFPADGAVVVPGFAAIPRGCGAPEAAKTVVDWLMGDTAQAAVIHGHMHSPFPGLPPPTGAPALTEIKTFPVAPDFYAHMAETAAATRARLAP